jgi:hypothetical protein
MEIKILIIVAQFLFLLFIRINRSVKLSSSFFLFAAHLFSFLFYCRLVLFVFRYNKSSYVNIEIT